MAAAPCSLKSLMCTSHMAQMHRKIYHQKRGDYCEKLRKVALKSNTLKD